MESLALSVFFPVLISFITAPACSQSLHASQNPLPVGSNVTLYSTSSVSTGAWLFNNDIIVMIFQGGEIISDQWKKRVTYNSSANHTSLAISSLQVADSGNYTLQSMNLFRIQLELSVQVPISNVTARAQATGLVEFNDTAVLTCSVSNGSSPSYTWLNNSTKVVTNGGRVQLADGGAKLMIVGVSRKDTGPFRCNVSNGISYELSSPVSLNVSYGPSDAKMTIMPMEHIHRTGSNITLTCSAEFSPFVYTQWMFNGASTNHFTASLHLENVTVNSSGNYQCQFHNPVTSRFATASASIQVVAPVTGTSVRIAGGQPILNHTLNLTCETTGSVTSIIWMYNWSPLVEDSSKFLSMDNATLTFSPIVRADNGKYQCVASNPLSNSTGGFTLEYFYGPETAMITGANDAQTQDTATLRCDAPSNPPSNYTWFFNGSSVANTSELVTAPLTVNMSGIYTCVAYNNITGQESSAYTMLTVHDEITFVQVMAPAKPAIEGHSYKLMCNVTGPAEHIYWVKNGKLVHEDNTTSLHMENRTLKFYLLDRNDRGHYQCIASNPVWNVSSPKYQLRVNYGPDEPVIYGQTFAEYGKIANLTCSAASYPYSWYSWWFNETEVASTWQFHIGPLSFNQSGEYTCMAYNNVTMKNSTNSIILTVIETIDSVMIRNDSVPINNENFTLTCEVTGSSDKIYWMKDGMLLGISANAEDERMSFQTENTTLQFTPVTIHDDGVYQCTAHNNVSLHQSQPYNLRVNYGPLDVHIWDPVVTGLGFTVTLECSADSWPGGVFRWFYNNRSSFLEDGPVLTMPEDAANDGNYICEVWNPVTNITMYTMKDVTFGHANPITAPSKGSLLTTAVFALSFLLHN